MNSFGRIFRLSIFGESHGACVGVVLDGCPAGLSLDESDFSLDLERRKGVGIQYGVTKRQESDRPLLQTGVSYGRTTGAPLVIVFKNYDIDSGAYENLKDTPRPGHADWVALCKFGGFADMRGSGHFSGRLTAPLVAAGVVAKKLLKPSVIMSNLLEVGGSQDIEQTIAEAVGRQDSVGGLIECRVAELPAGLGEPFFDSLESIISHAVFSIPAVNGIEFGDGFKACRSRGSLINDVLKNKAGQTHTNHAGGVNGGISNSNELIFRVSIKPTSSISAPQLTLNLKLNKPVAISITGRHDACIALRAPVIVEAMAAVALADLMLLTGMMPRVL
jgi:chorismate synthase